MASSAKLHHDDVTLKYANALKMNERKTTNILLLIIALPVIFYVLNLLSFIFILLSQQAIGSTGPLQEVFYWCYCLKVVLIFRSRYPQKSILITGGIKNQWVGFCLQKGNFPLQINDQRLKKIN